MSTLEVMFRQLVNDALRSDARAMKLLLSLVDRYGDSPEAALPLDIANILERGSASAIKEIITRMTVAAIAARLRKRAREEAAARKVLSLAERRLAELRAVT